MGSMGGIAVCAGYYHAVICENTQNLFNEAFSDFGNLFVHGFALSN